MHPLTLVFLASVVLVVKETAAGGAGRAFPMHAENYIIDNFQNVNARIEWDPTNFLVDQSGWYANCNNVRRGYSTIPEVTPEGRTIGVVYDHINGHGVDAESVNMYIRSIVDKWMRSHEHDGTIRGADRFGCSVRPGCSGVATVACLFSPAADDDQDDKPEPINSPEGQAFTNEQYDMAERITGNRWDRSHFLENLSGFEITCSMMDDADWPFTKAVTLAREYGMNVMGLKGETRNEGSTQDAMEIILRGFKSIQTSTNVGCSVIPDCTSNRGDLGGEMWVVVSCIYEEY